MKNQRPDAPEDVSLPLIDASCLDHSQTVQDLSNALLDYGFLYLKNRGISKKLQDEVLNISRNFFSEADALKMQISMKKAGLAWRGYFPVGGELTSGKPDQKEGIYFGRETKSGLPLHGPNLWPEGEKYLGFRNSVLSYMQQLCDLGQRLMSSVGLGLGLPPDYFKTRFTSEPTTLFRIFNYPVAHSQKVDDWGVREHTDMGFLTILLQDQNPGLQIKTKNQTWISAPPLDDTFVVNIGDMLEVWTHGLYRATPHRVRNEAKTDRLSFPFFFDPSWNSTLEPIDLKNFSEEKRNLVLSSEITTSTRWDGLNLKKLPQDTTYGEFVWAKVKNVFPELANRKT